MEKIRKCYECELEMKVNNLNKKYCDNCRYQRRLEQARQSMRKKQKRKEIIEKRCIVCNVIFETNLKQKILCGDFECERLHANEREEVSLLFKAKKRRF